MIPCSADFPFLLSRPRAGIYREQTFKLGCEKTAYGPVCAQTTELGIFAGPPNQNEDYLYLNIFSPNANISAKLPVIVWVHGDGDFCGASNDYDASKLASHGTVVVTFNYRLGLFGWLAHPALDSEGPLRQLWIA